MHVLHQVDAARFQRAGCCRHIGRLKVKVEMFAGFHEFNGRILLVHQFQMNHRTTGTTGVEILVLELKRQPQFGGVKPNRPCKISGA